MLLSDRLKVLRELSLHGTMGDFEMIHCQVLHGKWIWIFLYLQERKKEKLSWKQRHAKYQINSETICYNLCCLCATMCAPAHPLSKRWIHLEVSSSLEWFGVTKPEQNQRATSDAVVFLHLCLKEIAFWGGWRSAVIERLQWGEYKRTGISETRCRWTWEPERRD